mmetsp:Transcript_2506/g.3836  ORF Transcript_2506/g.3836 Transcript_2506/m.3836 type:complete len:81 (+) Transcript_2506:2102-2344(+)
MLQNTLSSPNRSGDSLIFHFNFCSACLGAPFMFSSSPIVCPKDLKFPVPRTSEELGLQNKNKNNNKHTNNRRGQTETRTS